MCPAAIASVGADGNEGIDLKAPSWHRFLHALSALTLKTSFLIS